MIISAMACPLPREKLSDMSSHVTLSMPAAATKPASAVAKDTSKVTAPAAMLDSASATAGNRIRTGFAAISNKFDRARRSEFGLDDDDQLQSRASKRDFPAAC